MSEKQSAPHIVLENVSKTYSASGKIFENINMHINRGEFVVLLGPSGSGKSTLLRLIAGLEKPTSGNVILKESGQHEKGFVFQEAHLLPWRNVKQNIALPLELMGSSGSDNVKKVDAILSQVGLESSALQYPAELSGGMKMRASLARALVSEPKLLLLDEPFAALDEQMRFKLGEELRAFWLKHSLTVVFVTHSLHEACFLGDRILAIADKPARIIADFKIKLPKDRNNFLRTEIIFSEQLKKLYTVIDEGWR